MTNQRHYALWQSGLVSAAAEGFVQAFRDAWSIINFWKIFI